MRPIPLAALAALFALPARAQDAPSPSTPARPTPTVSSPAVPTPAPTPTPTPAPTPAANLAALQPCGAQAARYEGAKGFEVVVMRIGRASVDNPLRPLTPEVSQVLQVAIGGKLATAYGADLTALRRGSAPAALEAQLGAPIRWEAALPDLPDPLPIVAEDGTPLASLAFRTCIDPPAVKAAAVARGTRSGKGSGNGSGKEAEKGTGSEAGKAMGGGTGKDVRKPGPRRDAAPKAAPGFQVPQGAIAE